jgi:drug/metabolite transporter (DMT)-like permease
MAYLLALLAAVAFALGTVLQQKGTLEVPAEEGDPRFLAQILRRPVWLAGAGMQATGWVLQAAALDRGALMVVQSLTTLSLVFALPLGAWITDQRITRSVTFGAIAIVAGIVVFLTVGSPRGRPSTPSSADWWAAGICSALTIGVLFVLGRPRTGAAKALLFGSAAGVGYALQAAVTKEFVTLAGQGLGTLLTSWTIYVLIASAALGFVLQAVGAQNGRPGARARLLELRHAAREHPARGHGLR